MDLLETQGRVFLMIGSSNRHDYLSLEAPDVRTRAIEDPRGFLARGDRLILDEIQRVPEFKGFRVLPWFLR